MSTISNTAPPREAVTGGLLAMAAAVVRRWWGAYIAWRAQEAAIAHLKSMSDRNLKDIGLSRSQIDAAVKGRIDLVRDRAVARMLSAGSVRKRREIP